LIKSFIFIDNNNYKKKNFGDRAAAEEGGASCEPEDKFEDWVLMG